MNEMTTWKWILLAVICVGGILSPTLFWKLIKLSIEEDVEFMAIIFMVMAMFFPMISILVLFAVVIREVASK